MGSMTPGDMSLHHVIEDMRMGRHPAQQWEVDKQYWVIRTILTYMEPSAEVQAEAWAEFRALKLDAPVKPYDRHPALQDDRSGASRNTTRALP